MAARPAYEPLPEAGGGDAGGDPDGATATSGDCPCANGMIPPSTLPLLQARNPAS